jgi:hypothetical protein
MLLKVLRCRSKMKILMRGFLAVPNHMHQVYIYRISLSKELKISEELREIWLVENVQK